MFYSNRSNCGKIGKPRIKNKCQKKGLPAVDIEILKEKTERITGKPKSPLRRKRVAAEAV